MRVLVMSDIHANYTALEAVLKDAGQVDETWCLGDLVGYGPDPIFRTSPACLATMTWLPSERCRSRPSMEMHAAP